MSKTIVKASCLSFLMLCAGTVRAFDCDKWDASESLGSYLLEYSHQSQCTETGLKARAKALGLGDKPMKEVDADSRHVGPLPHAWESVSQDFKALRDAAPAGQMKAVYGELAVRASRAEDELNQWLQTKTVPTDSPLFYANAWDSPGLVLLPHTGSPPALNAINVRQKLDEDCTLPQSASCQAAVRQGRQMILSWQLAQRLAFDASAPDIKRLKDVTTAISRQWSTFFHESKTMLPPDIVATDLLEGEWAKTDSYRQGFRTPPPRQWFFMHPSVGMEYAAGAPDGQRLKPNLILEIIGVNYWDPQRRPVADVPVLKNLSGLSFVMSYADRAGVKDTAPGVMLTFDSSYAVTLSRHGGKNSIAVSVDLLNLFKDKLQAAQLKWKGVAAEAAATPALRPD